MVGVFAYVGVVVGGGLVGSGDHGDVFAGGFGDTGLVRALMEL